MHILNTRAESSAQAPLRCNSTFASEIDTGEFVASIRLLRTAVQLHLQYRVDLIVMLTLAETGDAEWISRVGTELLRLPSHHRRRLLVAHPLQIGAV